MHACSFGTGERRQHQKKEKENKRRRLKMAIVMHQPFWCILAAGKNLHMPDISDAFLKTNMLAMDDENPCVF